MRELLTRAFTDPKFFVRAFMKITLRRYQLKALPAILESIHKRKGLEFLIIFPRQSGKNELMACLLVYLLTLYKNRGASMVFAAEGDGVARGMRRLDQRLDNVLTKSWWKKVSKPLGRTIGKAVVYFLSSHPSARSRGETADRLIVVDELQDQVSSHIEAVMEPMRAAHNATAVYLGTVKLSSDALGRKRKELEKLETMDGIQRVFLVSAEEVMAENEHWKRFVEGKVKQFGRKHPIVAAEYFNEAMDADGGLFNPRRRQLMRGSHKRLVAPVEDEIYIATIDVAGEDEGATDPVAMLENPARDYTVLTVWRVIELGNNVHRYEMVAVEVWHGRKHFVTHGQFPPLSLAITSTLDFWNCQHTICDASGIGRGLTSWLQEEMGEDRVTGFEFYGRGKKASLGLAFVGLIELNRVKVFDEGDVELSDEWWFFQQCAGCGMELKDGGKIEKDLKWGVPAKKKIDTDAEGLVELHDDRLLSATLIAHGDQLIKDGDLYLGGGGASSFEAIDLLIDS